MCIPRNSIRLGLIVLVAICFSSCGFGTWVSSLFGGKLAMTVKSMPSANLNNPVQVDVLLIYDEGLLKQLMDIPAKDWFEKRSAVRKNYPDGEGYDSWSWEWIPEQTVQTQKLPLRVAAKAAVIYANYYTSGAHRVRISPHADFEMILEEKGFVVKTLE